MTSWLAMNKWVNDGVPFPGAAFAQWIGDYYQRNGLVRGEIAVAGSRSTCRGSPPPSWRSPGRTTTSSRRPWPKPLVDLVSSADREYLELLAGHVGLLAGSGARDCSGRESPTGSGTAPIEPPPPLPQRRSDRCPQHP